MKFEWLNEHLLITTIILNKRSSAVWDPWEPRPVIQSLFCPWAWKRFIFTLRPVFLGVSSLIPGCMPSSLTSTSLLLPSSSRSSVCQSRLSGVSSGAVISPSWNTTHVHQCYPIPNYVHSCLLNFIHIKITKSKLNMCISKIVKTSKKLKFQFIHTKLVMQTGNLTCRPSGRESYLWFSEVSVHAPLDKVLFSSF